MNAFYYGINLGWIAGIFLALFIVGASWQHQCVQSHRSIKAVLTLGTPLSGAHWPPWWDWLGYSHPDYDGING
jgi:hypothetical protein